MTKKKLAKRIFALMLATGVVFSGSAMNLYAEEAPEELSSQSQEEIQVQEKDSTTKDNQKKEDDQTVEEEQTQEEGQTEEKIQMQEETQKKEKSQGQEGLSAEENSTETTTDTTGAVTTETATTETATTETATTETATTESTTESTSTETTASQPLPVGTLISIGSYQYKITSENTATIMGFAENASESQVIVKKEITYEGVTYTVNRIAVKAFEKESCIKKVLIRKNVTDIGRKAFFQCKNLTKVRMKTGVKLIRKSAFRGCSNLDIINIKSTVLSEVKANAFYKIQSGAVINVASNEVKTLLKASIPSYVKINKAFGSTSSAN